MKKFLTKISAAVLAAVPALAMAAPPDLTPLTNNIDFSTVVAAVLAIAGLLATVYVAIKGAKTVLHMVRGS